MCICNLIDEVEFLNTVSNMDQPDKDFRDGPTPEAVLNKAVANLEKGDPLKRIHDDAVIEDAKLKMFDELVEALESTLPFISGWPMSKSRAESIEKLLARTKQFQETEK